MIRKLTQEEYNNAADLSYQVYMECGRNAKYGRIKKKGLDNCQDPGIMDVKRLAISPVCGVCD